MASQDLSSWYNDDWTTKRESWSPRASTPVPTQGWYGSSERDAIGNYWGKAEDITSGNLRGLNQQLSGLRSMQKGMEGDRMSIYASWMIGNTITGLQNRANRAGRQNDRAIGAGQTAELEGKWAYKTGNEADPGNINKIGWDDRDRYARFDAMGRDKSGDVSGSMSRTPPIPEWMQKFFTQRAWEANEAVGKKQPSRGHGRPEKVAEPEQKFNWGSPFMPMSAQQELDPDQLTDMMAYWGWAGAGRPMKGDAKGMAALEQGTAKAPVWFDYYVQKSQGLFPKQQNPNSMRGRWRS